MIKLIKVIILIKIGIDMIENNRIIKKCSEDFINKVLTQKEILMYKKRIGKKQSEFICGRFAAKEAIIKAISDFENPHMLEIEILSNDNGAPIVNYKNYNILVSISHVKKYTIAEAMLIYK